MSTSIQRCTLGCCAQMQCILLGLISELYPFAILAISLQ